MRDARLLVLVSGTLLLTDRDVQNIGHTKCTAYKQMDINTLYGQNVEFVSVKHCGA